MEVLVFLQSALSGICDVQEKGAWLTCKMPAKRTFSLLLQQKFKQVLEKERFSFPTQKNFQRLILSLLSTPRKKVTWKEKGSHLLLDLLSELLIKGADLPCNS